MRADEPKENSFLQHCDPRSKLGAFFVLIFLLLTKPFGAPGAQFAMVCVVLALVGSNVEFSRFFSQLLRLRWLFAALLFFHGLMTPGPALIPGIDAVSRQGVVSGAALSFRLVLMVALSWILLRTTTHMEIFGALGRLLGFVERLGLPLSRGLALLAYTLGRIPQLFHAAALVRDDMVCRLGEARGKSWQERLQRLAVAGEALLLRLLRSALSQEESLMARGVSRGLPPLPVFVGRLGWRDGVVFGVAILSGLMGIGL